MVMYLRVAATTKNTIFCKTRSTFMKTRYERPITRSQDKPFITDDAIQITLVNHATTVSGLFAQTSSYWRSEVYLHHFKQAYRDKQFEKAKGILIDIYLNYSLLTKPDALILLDHWESNLTTFYNLPNIDLTSHLLATTLLLLITTKNKTNMQNKFKTMLYLLSRETPQLANSILAVFSQIKKDDDIYESCKIAHNIKAIFTENATTLDTNEIKLIISPFILSYAKENYLSPVLKEIQSSNHEMNTLQSIYVMLKLLPPNHAFLTKPQNPVRDLIFQLSRYSNSFIYAKARILQAIQSRIKNKSFIKTYLNDSKRMYDHNNPLVELLTETINQSEKSEEFISSHLEKNYYPQIQQLPDNLNDNNFFIRLMHYTNKLTSEKNMIIAINHLFPLLSKAPALCEAAISAINILLPKIHDQEFLVTYIKNVFQLTLIQPNVNILTQLGQSCVLYQLNDKNINDLREEFFSYHEENPGASHTYCIMLALCLVTRDETNILKSNTWQKLNHLNMCEQPIEWFKNSKNFMLLECYFFLAMKITKNTLDIKNYLFKLYSLLDDKNMAFKAAVHGTSLCHHIQDQDVAIQWIQKLTQEKIPNFDYEEFIASSTYFIKDLTMIRKNLDFIKTVLTNPNQHNIHQPIQHLLGYLPHQLANELSGMIYDVAKQDATTLMHIKNFIQKPEKNTIKLTLKNYTNEI